MRLIASWRCIRGARAARFCVAFLLSAAYSFAQDDFKPKFGTIDRASLEMTAYPGDSTADAVFLYDYGEINFTYDDLRGILMTMKSWTRIKILKESALDRASISIPYYNSTSYAKSEVIEDIKGYTYNLQGGEIVTTPLERRSVTTDKSSDMSWNSKFNLPNVKKGSIIEYAYTRTTPLNYKDNPGTWLFQGPVPFKWSEYRITIPNIMDYKITMGGYLPLHVNDQAKVQVRMGHSKFDGPGTAYRFVVKDAPAFSKEPFITTANDYLSKIEFELSSTAFPEQPPKQYSQTWENVDRTLIEAPSFGGELRKNVFSKELREEIAGKAKDSTEKMLLAYAYIQKTMKWDGYAGLGSKVGIRKAFDNKKGNAADINLMLINLLRDLGFDCNPVVLSTRSNGQIMAHIPLLERFNYVIGHVEVGGNEYLLDATQAYTKAGLLPEHVLNGTGRLIPKKGIGDFIALAPKDTKVKLEMVTATISPEDGTMKGTYALSMGGYEALNWRKKYISEPDQIYYDDLKKQFPEWQLKEISVSNKDESLDGAVNVKCSFEIEDEKSSPGVFYFNPILMGRVHENPLKSPERIYPLDFTTGQSSSFIGTFNLPDGYVLEELPKPEIILLPEKAGKFSYQVRQNGNVIQVNSTLMISKLKFLPEEYGNLREFYDRVVQRHAQTLVIKKK